MPRILLLIVLVWILYVVLKRFAAFTATNNTKKPHSSPSEKIVACNHCGLHIPESETQTINNKVYCNNPDCHP